jgi:hypothetical protein
MKRKHQVQKLKINNSFDIILNLIIFAGLGRMSELQGRHAPPLSNV